MNSPKRAPFVAFALLFAGCRAPAASTHAQPVDGAAYASVERATPPSATRAGRALPELDPSCAQTVDPAATWALDCLLSAGRWHARVKELSDGWRVRFMSYNAVLPAEQQRSLEVAFALHASTEALYEGLHRRLMGQRRALHMASTFAWYRSPLGKKYAAALHAPMDERKRHEMGESGFDKNREIMIQALALNSGYERHAPLMTWMPMAKTMQSAASSSGATRFDIEKYAHYDASRAHVADEFLTWYYRLRGFSLDELTQLNGRMSEPDVRSANELGFAALGAAVDEAALALGPVFHEAMDALDPDARAQPAPFEPVEEPKREELVKFEQACADMHAGGEEGQAGGYQAHLGNRRLENAIRRFYMRKIVATGRDDRLLSQHEPMFQISVVAGTELVRACVEAWKAAGGWVLPGVSPFRAGRRYAQVELEMDDASDGEHGYSIFIDVENLDVVASFCWNNFQP